MEHSVKSQKLLDGKKSSDKEDFQMVLRSGDRRHTGFSDRSSVFNSKSVHGSPVKNVILRKSVQHHNQQFVHHHHHHHVHDHHQSSHNSSGVHIHMRGHTGNQSHHGNWDSSGRQTHKAKSVSREIMKKSSELREQAFSDYSSGNESDAEIKTDYTYAGSGSYNSRVTPTRHCPSPNMSRSHLRRSNESYKSYMSSDESIESDDEKIFKTGSSSEKIRFLRTSTPSVVSLGVEKNILNFHSALAEDRFLNAQADMSVSNSYLRTSTSNADLRGVESSLYSSRRDFGEQVSFLSDHSSQDILSQTVSFLSMCSSIISHSVYKFICLVTSTDTFILSRCCSSGSKKLCAFLLFLLLPLLLWLLPMLLNSSGGKSFHTDYLNSLLSSTSEKETALKENSRLTVDRLALSEALSLHGQWQDELEKKLHRDLESRWTDQIKQIESKWHREMEQWQGNVISRVNDIDVKTVNEEVALLKTKLEEQLRHEDSVKSTTQEELKAIVERLSHLEEKQKVMETLLLDLENCCKKQSLLPVGVSQAELAVQLSALAQEVRTNLSQLVLVQSSAASGSNHAEDIHFTPKYISNRTVPSLGEIEKIIKVALDRYNADKTGLVDYALESAGGSVVSTRCTESYPLGTAQFSLFGVPFWYSANTPRTVIQPQVHPGECWAMRGTQGYLVIQLSAIIRPTGFSLEHIPRELSPTGKIDSAPKEFSVFGLSNEKDTEGQLLGNFAYVDNGEPLQIFHVQNPDCGTFSIVELRIHSNHGNPEYTCLYRFRVHGTRQ